MLEADKPGVVPRVICFTASDRAQLEHFQLLELLQNCRGPLAFAAASCDPADPNKEYYPNEWVLRCMVESGQGSGDEGKLLDRWRRTVRQTTRPMPKLGKSESEHLRAVWERRRDPTAPFDEYLFNFVALTGPDELPWAEAWSASELDAAWNRPATFAMGQVFGAQPVARRRPTPDARRRLDAVGTARAPLAARRARRYEGAAPIRPRRLDPRPHASACAAPASETETSLLARFAAVGVPRRSEGSAPPAAATVVAGGVAQGGLGDPALS